MAFKSSNIKIWFCARACSRTPAYVVQTWDNFFWSEHPHSPSSCSTSPTALLLFIQHLSGASLLHIYKSQMQRANTFSLKSRNLSRIVADVAIWRETYCVLRAVRQLTGVHSLHQSISAGGAHVSRTPKYCIFLTRIVFSDAFLGH